MVQVRADVATPPASPQGPSGEASAAALLDLHEGISTPPLWLGHETPGEWATKPPRIGCARWPEPLRLVNAVTGEIVRGRCGATNLCAYCQRLYVVETVEMLTLDAMERAPTCWVVLTAREHLTRADCYSHLTKLRTRLRKRWPEIEWFVQVEFQRRGALHLNLLIKGVDWDRDGFELWARAASLWCSRVDALPIGQWADAVADGVGVVRYISKMLAHGLKAEQAPPIGWRGHRTSQTRGYLVRPASVMRQEARASLREKRALYAAVQQGLAGEVAEAFVRDTLEQADAAEWRLFRSRKLLGDQLQKHADWHVWRPILRAAFEWQEQRDAIRSAREPSAGHPVPARALEGARGRT